MTAVGYNTHALRSVTQVTLNQSLLQSEDVMKAVTATINKEKPDFAKLWQLQYFQHLLQ